jgi:hypothetical protein
MQQREASAHTMACYRDTFRLLLNFVQKRLCKALRNHTFRTLSRCRRPTLDTIPKLI